MYIWVADFLNGEYITSPWFDSLEQTVEHAYMNRKYILINMNRSLDEFYMFYVENGQGLVVTHGNCMFSLIQLNEEY